VHRNANSTLVWWNAKYGMGAFPHFKLDLHDECDLLVDSVPCSAVNTRRTPLQDAFVHKCDDWLFAWSCSSHQLSTGAGKAEKRPKPPHNGIHLVTDLLRGRWGQWGRTPWASEQHYYPRDGVLIVDNLAHSSRPAAIFCFAFSTTLQGRGGRGLAT